MRPTPQMVREALFSILGNAIPGRVFYDIFAGTGINGFEAISRGASRTVLIEKDVKQANEMQRYAEQFRVGNLVSVLRADAYRWAERWVPPPVGPVNLFVSPPFPDLSPARLREFLPFIRTLLDKATEHSTLTIQAEEGFPIDDLPDGPDCWDIRRYGRNWLFVRVKETVPPEPLPASTAESMPEPTTAPVQLPPS
jgi:16S rRNA (guanine966-N2)-methyltransferase